MTSSFKPYGKISEAEQAMLDARRRAQKRISVIIISSLLLIAIVVAAVLGTSAARNNSNKDGTENKPLSTSMKAVCDITLYPETCQNVFAPLINSSTNLMPNDIAKLSIRVALDELERASNKLFSQAISNSTDMLTVQALTNCQELLDLAFDHLNETLSSDKTTFLQAIADLRTWLSSAATDQQTCIDDLQEINSTLGNSFAGILKNSTELTSNSLAITTWLGKLTGSLNLRRLMSSGSEPEWMDAAARKLLESADLRKQAKIVVATDGSGKYKKINDALKAVPDKSDKRTVIYVKRGVYYENVIVDKNKWNVVVVGDGMTATIVSGSLNFVDGTPTFSSATFAVKGKGFWARDIGFRNTAGAAKHQAVALISQSDQSVFYRCHFDAFQDTLYVHSNRQFYRECNIYGTVDFIFGNSAVVIQSSNIMPKQPMQGQQNTITAQGKIDPNQNTGISIQNCLVKPYGNLGDTRTYLGRPWKNYSTTVFMQSSLASFIDPTGWLPWVGTSAPDTIFYAEFANWGPGSSTAKRVKWKGVRYLDSNQASKFTVSSFLGGSKFISSATVPFKSGL